MEGWGGGRSGPCVCVAGAGGDGDGGVEEEGQVSWFGGEPTIRKDPLETAGRGMWLEHGLGLVQQRPECQASLAVSEREKPLPFRDCRSLDLSRAGAAEVREAPKR